MKKEQSKQYTCFKSPKGIAKAFKIATASQLKFFDLLALARYLVKNFDYVKFIQYVLIWYPLKHYVISKTYQF